MQSHWTPKELRRQLEKDGLLLLQFSVAKELGMTLARLRQEMTLEELLGWSCYFQISNEQQQKAMRRGR
jgi:hypothetical protein